jgi:predicted dithiol-disulfide oxidoreductase (DUF899 family)
MFNGRCGMSDQAVVNRERWLEKRRELLRKEKEFTRLRDELSAERRKLPMVEVDKSYVFAGPALGDRGSATLLELFEGRRQLFVYHFMFDPSWDEGCPSCSFFVDNLPDLSHLNHKDTTFAAVSRAPLDKITAYQRRMGWEFPWYSSYDSDFNYDYHVTQDPRIAPMEYNFEDMSAMADDLPESGSMELPGQSFFLREGDRVFHTYSNYARGADIFLTTYNVLDHTALGRQESWEPPPNYASGDDENFHRHDEY